jgi:hypothetical protein
MVVHDLKEMVKDGKLVTFSHYYNKNLWYKTSTDFLFPVPIEETELATFHATEKALLLMRYIRKHIELLKTEGSISYGGY